MKYFTPQRLAAYASDDEATRERGEREWEEQIERYDRYLATIKPRFSPNLKQVADGYYLHDADVLTIGRTGDQLLFVLQFDTVQRPVLLLRYDLVEGPKIDPEALPESERHGGTPMWQYDEVELVEGEPPTWRQSILLSNGWEITLHFRDVEVEEAEAILPAPRPSSWRSTTDLAETA